ncbi:ornithine--oxo-acid aminotransferase [candidate division TA06 bacterium SM23_40]|uniref:ornithine aminotransferase n=2 Tax=Bacteria division TA06 TaxID=1156500 RepID=A0A0S8G919_UNCT6|nr:MAG: ornithine--oxo-acid aminotransferase [candidate division TA06 bacterium SM23_40]
MATKECSATEACIDLVDRYSAHNYLPLPVVIARAEGVWVWDVEDKQYLDMLSAYSALNQGHRHPKIMAALHDQAARLTLTSRAFHNDQFGPLCKNLCDLAHMESTLVMNTGAEAVETAVKAARKWGYTVKGVPRDRAEIIVCDNNFHGRTTTIVGFSSEEQYRSGFGPFAPGFRLIPYNNIDALEKAITAETVAFLVEPIQGEAGIIVPDDGYLRAAADICERHNVLLALDEIQTGLGRTGKMFCCEYDGISPDILILGKALGGGVIPISAILASREVMDVFTPGDHGSTFGGNPLACAVAIAALDVIIGEKLPEKAAQLGAYFVSELEGMDSPHIKEIRGRGLLIGAYVKESSGTARTFCEKLMEEGILAKETHGQVIRFAPPLIATKEDIDWALERIVKLLT